MRGRFPLRTLLRRKEGGSLSCKEEKICDRSLKSFRKKT